MGRHPDEVVVPAELAPGSIGDFVQLDKPPVAFAAASLDSQVITHSRGEVNAGTVVLCVLGTCPAKDIGPVIGLEGTDIRPLCIAYPATAMHGNPAHVTDGFAFGLKGAVKPRDYALGTGFCLGPVYPVIIGQGDIEGVEAGDKALRAEVRCPVGGIRVIIAPVVLHPLCVPGTGGVVHRVGGSGFLSDPENCRGDVPAPGVDWSRGPGERGSVGTRQVVWA